MKKKEFNPNCIVCGALLQKFLLKYFSGYNLAKVEYYKCVKCGLVISKTHAELSDEAWEKLNGDYHSTYQGGCYNPDDPKWIERLKTQAVVLSDAYKIGLIKKGKWLDYACGDGKLSDHLKKEHNIFINNYDRYMPQQNNYADCNQLIPGTFDFVITTSVFEHFTLREQFDNVNTLVNPRDGVLGIHTLVCGSIPKDPSWFYFLPVHCSFQTNTSMDFLFGQWGYHESVYNVDGRLWLWFRKRSGIKDIVDNANRRSNGPFYIHKYGFVDYWK